MLSPELLEKAAREIEQAEAILIGAGAGMGVDSGLPDFRGDEGFWNAYPPYRHLNCSFMDMANPHWFEKDIAFAWGFYGHRRNLYRQTKPHQGFEILKRWGDGKEYGAFVYTSNVDFQFQRAGFHPRNVVECHGTIEWNQCLRDCGQNPHKAGKESIVLDEKTMRAQEPLPACPGCGGPSRPNILMFGDWGWDNQLAHMQSQRLGTWLERLPPGKLVIIELGAGQAIATVRWFCQNQAHGENKLIRINPREYEVAEGQIGLAGGALEVLQKLDQVIST